MRSEHNTYEGQEEKGVWHSRGDPVESYKMFQPPHTAAQNSGSRVSVG